MEDSLGKQHHYPAALIGNFSSETGRRRRYRRVFAARRGQEQVFHQRAEQFGVTPRHPRLYDSPAGTPPIPMALDDLWLMAEDRIENLDRGLGIVEQCGNAPAGWFVMDAGPFVASLLARHPRLADSGLPDLTANPTARARGQRWAYFGILADVILFRVRWTLALAPEETPWTTNDIGAIWLPGRGGGNILVPISPRHAIMLTAGHPSYAFNIVTATIKPYEWDGADVAVVNEVIARSAPAEVIARDREQITTALGLWAGTRSTAISALGVPADCMANLDGTSAPRMLLANTRSDVELSWSRFMAATHLFGCNCDELFAEHGDPEAAREAQADMHRLLAVGADSLHGPQALHSGSEPGTAIAINTRGDVAEANRAGLMVRSNPAGIRGYVELGPRH